MTTRSTGRQTTAPQGGRTGGRTSRGGVDEVPDFSMVIAQQLQDLLPTIITQVGNHASNIQADVRSVNVNNGRNGCSYKEFMTCSPKDYDGKGRAKAYTRWIVAKVVETMNGLVVPAKAEIVCYEKVVRIPLPHGKILRILGEKSEEKMRHPMSAKAKEQKLKDIVVVRNFPEVFPNILSGLPPSREFEFRIDLIPGAMLVAKSPYRLTPSEMEELSSQLR
ncbi:hypothetical protein Tco_0622335 [Tanacetum coccineum]